MTLTWTFEDSSSQDAPAHYAPFAPKSRPFSRAAREWARSENVVGLAEPRSVARLRVLHSGSVAASPLITSGNKAGFDWAPRARQPTGRPARLMPSSIPVSMSALTGLRASGRLMAMSHNALAEFDSPRLRPDDELSKNLGDEAGRISRSRWPEVSSQASLSSGSSPFASPHSTHRDIEMGLSA